MKFRRPDIYWLVFCISALLFFSAGSRSALHDSRDFVPVYSGARCLFSGCNPYDTSQLEQQYLQSGGRAGELPAWDHQIPVYPPSALLVVSSLALLRYPAACLLWLLLNGCMYVTAAGLILSLCPRPQRWLATILVSLILGTSRVLLLTGQPATFAISLLIIGCYLFFRGRYLPLGAFVLMLSLAVKPQIGGMIVLYFFARGIHRRYAAAAMAGALALLLSAGLMLSLHPGSAGWASDLGANISASMKAGAINDPRPANVDATADTNLQALTSTFIADEREFNAAAYAVFLVLLAVLIMAVLRTTAGREMYFLSIGALSALTPMPVYHRYYDARMLLITVPAVAIVYQKRRLLGAMMGAVTVLIAIPVQTRAQLFLLDHAMWQSVVQHKFLFILLLRQQNLELLILFNLYMVAIFAIRFPGAAANREPSAQSTGGA
jgi:Flp pilus assembly pilin Flp